MRQLVIGFAGSMYAGKSTAAARLVSRFGFHRVRFAGPLKAMMAALGLSHEEIEGSLKETPSELLCGKTPRWAMQSIGTEWGRNLIGSELWVNAWRRAASGYELVVADDVRFPNEAEAIKSAGGVLIRVDRPIANTDRLAHASETQVFKCDRVLINHGEIEDLHARVDAVAREILDARLKAAS